MSWSVQFAVSVQEDTPVMHVDVCGLEAGSQRMSPNREQEERVSVQQCARKGIKKKSSGSLCMKCGICGVAYALSLCAGVVKQGQEWRRRRARASKVKIEKRRDSDEGRKTGSEAEAVSHVDMCLHV
ncbi:Hypothetical predicted protein [Scomber scombrus]|uniref:Uncharacterized protein n=1 Tax=Scomber scombrus TaxID=13677 RepID=A0AAV1MSE2_SCOSC